MKEIENYYRNGQTKYHFWRNDKGQMEGEYKSWYESGQPAAQCFYKNDLKEGEYKDWYGSGKLSIQCFYKNDVREGEHKHWFRTGDLLRHCFYKNGEFSGEYKSWNYDGQLIEHVFYHNGEKIDITEYAADIYNITEQEYFHLQLIFGYFPIIKFDGTEQ